MLDRIFRLRSTARRGQTSHRVQPADATKWEYQRSEGVFTTRFLGFAGIKWNLRPSKSRNGLLSNGNPISRVCATLKAVVAKFNGAKSD